MRACAESRGNAGDLNSVLSAETTIKRTISGVHMNSSVFAFTSPKIDLSVLGDSFSLFLTKGAHYPAAGSSMQSLNPAVSANFRSPRVTINKRTVIEVKGLA